MEPKSEKEWAILKPESYKNDYPSISDGKIELKVEWVSSYHTNYLDRLQEICDLLNSKKDDKERPIEVFSKRELKQAIADYTGAKGEPELMEYIDRWFDEWIKINNESDGKA